MKRECCALATWTPTICPENTWIGPPLGNAAARLAQVPWLTYCSEMVAENERRVSPGFMEDIPKPAPDEMVKYCKAKGWLVGIYKLIE